MRNTVIFEPKNWWKDHIYWLLKSSCFELFGDGKYGVFWAKKWMEKCRLVITEKFMFWTFRRWEIRYLFEPKSWWKDHIYQLLKSSCFELFRDGKYGLFWAKKLMEKLYVLGLSELSIILQDLGNMAFHAVKRGSLMGAKASKRFLIHHFNSFAASSEI